MQRSQSLDEFQGAMEPFSPTSPFRVDDMLFPTSYMVSPVDLSPLLQTPSQSRQGSPDMSDDPFAQFINDTPKSSQPDAAASIVLSTPPLTPPIPLPVAGPTIVTDCSSKNTLRQSSSSELRLSPTSPTSPERSLMRSPRNKMSKSTPPKLKTSFPAESGDQPDCNPTSVEGTQSPLLGETTNSAAEQAHPSSAAALPSPPLESDGAFVAQISAEIVSSTNFEHGVVHDLDDKRPDDAQAASTEEFVVVDKDRIRNTTSPLSAVVVAMTDSAAEPQKSVESMTDLALPIDEVVTGGDPRPMDAYAVHSPHTDSVLEGAVSATEYTAPAASCTGLATEVDPELQAGASELELAAEGRPRMEATSSPVSCECQVMTLTSRPPTALIIPRPPASTMRTP